jgi:tRNA dimethylallyltransferase
VRALERAIVSGSATPPAPVGYPAPVTWLGLALEPEEHRRRIRDRIDEQFESGLIDEAASLRARYGEDLPSFSAMGYREAFAVLDGRATMAEARAAGADRTWAYARRQRTWFRSEPDIEWVEAGARAGPAVAAIDALGPWLSQIGRSDYAGQR